MFLKLIPATRDEDALILVNAAKTTGYKMVSEGWSAAVFGRASIDASFLTSIDAPPVKLTETEETRSFTIGIRVQGDGTRGTLASRYQALMRAVQLASRKRGRLRYRGPGAAYPVEFVVHHIDVGDGWSHEAEAADTVVVDLTFTCDAYALMQPMDLADNFETDTLGTGGIYNDEGSDWTVQSGSSGLAVAAATLSMGKSSNLTTESILTHTGTPYTYGDISLACNVRFGSVATGMKCGLILKWIDANNYLEGYIDDNGTNTRVRIDEIIAGVRTNIYSTNVTRSTVNDEWRLGASLRGNTLNVGASQNVVSFPSTGSGGSPSATLSTAGKAAFGIGVEARCGLSLNPQHASTMVKKFQARPYCMHARNSSDFCMPHRMYGPIPGQAPALASIHTAVTAGQYGFTRIAAQPVPLRPNMTDGLVPYTTRWRSAAITNFVTNAATSVASSASAAASAGKYDPFCLVVTTPASTDSGLHTFVNGNFERARTVVARCWVRAPAGATTLVRVKFGDMDSVATGTSVALTSSWQQIEVEWTPGTSGTIFAAMAVTTAAATATVFHFSSPEVYFKDEGPPAITDRAYRQPPWGPINCRSMLGLTSGLAISASGGASGVLGYRGGWGTPQHPYVATGALADSLATNDPTLVVDVNPGALYGVAPGDTVAVQVWALIVIDSTSANTRITIGNYNYGNGANPRYSVEYGSAGVALTTPSAGTDLPRRVFLGTLLLDAGSGPDSFVTVALAVSRSAGGAFSVDEIEFTPADRTMMSPFGDDQANIATSTDNARVYAYDGTARAVQMGERSSDTGLYGAPMLLEPGVEHEIFALSATLTPNQPTASGGSEQRGGMGFETGLHVEVQPRIVIGGE